MRYVSLQGRRGDRRRLGAEAASEDWRPISGLRTGSLIPGATRSGCGEALLLIGPFYCRIDKKVYLDTSFFLDMKTKYPGGGDFAYAYVVAHEIGHHVQDLLGILDKVRRHGRTGKL